MSGINSFLADLYGNPDEGHVKQASADQLTDGDIATWNAFTKLAAEDGIDVNELDDEQVDNLYDHYSGDDGDDGDYGEAEGAGAEGDVEFPPNWDQGDVNHFVDLDEDGREQFAQFKEAEFLGEVIAHSQFSTLRKLAAAEMEKEAAGRIRAGAQYVDDAAQNLGGWLARKSDNAGAAVARKRLERGMKSKRLAKADASQRPLTKKDSRLVDKADKIHARAGQAPRELTTGQKRLRGYGAVGTGAAAATGAGLGIGLGVRGHRRKKEAEALEYLAEERALEFLKQAGIAAGDEEDTDDAINERAAQMLIDSGYGELLEE